MTRPSLRLLVSGRWARRSARGRWFIALTSAFRMGGPSRRRIAIVLGLSALSFVLVSGRAGGRGDGLGRTEPARIQASDLRGVFRAKSGGEVTVTAVNWGSRGGRKPLQDSRAASSWFIVRVDELPQNSQERGRPSQKGDCPVCERRSSGIREAFLRAGSGRCGRKNGRATRKLGEGRGASPSVRRGVSCPALRVF